MHDLPETPERTLENSFGFLRNTPAVKKQPGFSQATQGIPKNPASFRVIRLNRLHYIPYTRFLP